MGEPAPVMPPVAESRRAPARRPAPARRRHDRGLGGALRERYAPHGASVPDAARLETAWEAFAGRMADHYPFFHPRYAGQMLKPPIP